MRSVLRPAGMIAIVALTASCHDQACQGRSPAYLVVDSVMTGQGSTSTTTFTSGPLHSDVVFTSGAVFDDLGQAAMRLSLKDIGTGTTAPSASKNNEITITRYHVAYTRADGRNTPGVDVPFGFDGVVTATVPASGSAITFNFELVRVDAKLESPLIQLRSNVLAIDTIATITFYGHDQAANVVSVTASVAVLFANYADSL